MKVSALCVSLSPCMESRYFEQSVEPSRRKIIRSVKEEVLGARNVQRIDPNDERRILAETLPNGATWENQQEVLADANVYKSVQKTLVADLDGLIAGGAVLSDAASRIDEAQNTQLTGLEKATAELEAQVALNEALISLGKTGPERWVPAWKQGEDRFYLSVEPGLLENQIPPPAYADARTGLLTLPLLSQVEVYGPQNPGRLRLFTWAGGDVVEHPFDEEGPFQFQPLHIHTLANETPTTGDVPWVAPYRGPSVRLRLDLDTPSPFSRVAVSAGSRYLCKPGFLAWYPFGNEGEGSLLADSFFGNSLAGQTGYVDVLDQAPTGTSGGWQLFGSTGAVGFIPASASTGPDAGARLTGRYLLGEASPLCLIRPGIAEMTVSGGIYSQAFGAFQNFPPPTAGGALRLAVRWRGLGRFIDGANIHVTVEFYGYDRPPLILTENEARKLVHRERYCVKDGLANKDRPPAGEFSLSRFLVHCPAWAVLGRVILTATRPQDISDALATSQIEIAQVTLDTFGGRRMDWRKPVMGQEGSTPSYVSSVPFAPEAAFIEVVLAQEAFEKSPNPEGIYGKEYNFSLRHFSVDHNEYGQAGRWISRVSRFAAEPRRFTVHVADNVDLTGVEFKIILRAGEMAYSVEPDLPLQVISSEEESDTFDSNTVTLKPFRQTESFEGTDLSGQISLGYYPYIDKQHVLDLSSRLTANARRIEYDPNAVRPLLYTEPA